MFITLLIFDSISTAERAFEHLSTLLSNHTHRMARPHFRRIHIHRKKWREKRKQRNQKRQPKKKRVLLKRRRKRKKLKRRKEKITLVSRFLRLVQILFLLVSHETD